MYEVGVVEQFDATHALRGNFGPATQKHGHTYRVELIVRGDTLAPDGTLCDIGQLGDALRRTLDDLRERDLDELAPFRGRNTTAEVVAEHVNDRVRAALNGAALAAVVVRVWESPLAFAAVEHQVP